MTEPYSDPAFALSVRQAAMEYQVNHATKFTRDRSKSVGASECFKCPRALYLTKQDIATQNDNPDDKPPLMENGGFMMRGKVMEDAFVAPLLQSMYGDKIRCAGDDQRTYTSKDTEHLTATPDGIVTKDDGSEFIIEIKTIDPRARLTSPKPEHVLQTHIQMGVIGIPTYAKLLYVDASDYFKVTAFHIEYDTAVYDAAVVRAVKVMTATNPDDLDVATAMIMRECVQCKYDTDTRCKK